MLYFVKANSLLKKFDMVDIKGVPRIENQEADDLAYITLGYWVSKEKLKELIKVREKLISNIVLALELSNMKLVGVEELGDLNPKKKKLKLSPLTICQTTIGGNKL